MEKIKLNDGTVMEIQPGASEYEVGIVSESVDEVISSFTDDNLKRYEILTEAGETCAIYTNKHMRKAGAVAAEEGFYITITLEDIDEISVRLASLEETVDVLVMESLGL